MRRLLFGLLALTSTFPALNAQGVPYDSSVVGVTNNVSPSEGIWLADRTGASVAVTGLLAAGSAGSGVNAVQIDPIDGRVWLGGINSNGQTSNQVNWIRITGTVVSQFVQHATLPYAALSSVAAIAFDDNANPIACGSTAANAGGVFRVNRKLGGVATNIGSVASGTHNAICTDGAGNLYVGMFTAGQVHVMLKNPDCSFQPPVLLGSVAVTSISGITFVPAAGATPDELWISTFGAAGAMLFRMPKTGGPGVAVANTSTSSNWCEYDRRHDDVLLAISAPDNVEKVLRTGANSVLNAIQAGNVGTLSYIDVNNAVDGNVVVAPMCLNGGLGPFDLELGITCPPGSIAIVGTGFPSVVVLGFGLAGADGRFSVTIPGITLGAPLAPASLGFLGACLDLGTGNLTIGAPVFWPAN